MAIKKFLMYFRYFKITVNKFKNESYFYIDFTDFPNSFIIWRTHTSCQMSLRRYGKDDLDIKGTGSVCVVKLGI